MDILFVLFVLLENEAAILRLTQPQPQTAKKDGRHVSASCHNRKMKRMHLSMAATILSKLRYLEPESVQ